jgi:hypothetical protein
VDRIGLPAHPEGPRFTPRELPDGDAALHVLKGTGAAMWRYHASVIAHAPAASVAARLPPAVTVDPVDEHTCRIQVGSDTPEMLALYLGMLGADFEIENPSAHPELLPSPRPGRPLPPRRRARLASHLTRLRRHDQADSSSKTRGLAPG